jgi:hypothetical protein
MTTRTLTRLLRLSPLAVACTIVQAQDVDDLMFGPPELFAAELATPTPEVHLLLDADDNVAFAAGELHRERVVKGAPYCADAVQESVQPLADGNRIVRKQSTRLCRDGEGRTRQEVERGGRKIVYLRDPVSQQSWVLDPERKTARRLGLHVAGHAAEFTDGAAWREYGEKMREWARTFHNPPAPPAPPALAAPAAPAVPAQPAMPVVITEESREVRDAKGRPRKDVQVQVIRIEGPGAPMPPMALPALPPVPAIAPLPPGVAFRAQIGAPRGPGVATALGTKDVEGVKANGERTTWTIEAGKIGNEKPIVITRDVWTSPELMVTVLSKDSDPRVGETTYRLANLRRGEPEAALMKVPADFQVSKATPWSPATPKASSAPIAKG